MAGFRDLEVWQLGRRLANSVYELTRSFPKDEQYGLTSQLRRAATSVPCNIAEGWGRNSDGSFTQFLRIARGSLNEVETLIVIATDQGYATESDHDQLVADIEVLGRKLYNLTEKVSKNIVREDLAEYNASPSPLSQSSRSLPSSQSSPPLLKENGSKNTTLR